MRAGARGPSRRRRPSSRPSRARSGLAAYTLSAERALEGLALGRRIAASRARAARAGRGGRPRARHAPGTARQGTNVSPPGPPKSGHCGRFVVGAGHASLARATSGLEPARGREPPGEGNDGSRGESNVSARARPPVACECGPVLDGVKGCLPGRHRRGETLDSVSTPGRGRSVAKGRRGRSGSGLRGSSEGNRGDGYWAGDPSWVLAQGVAGGEHESREGHRGRCASIHWPPSNGLSRALLPTH